MTSISSYDLLVGDSLDRAMFYTTLLAGIADQSTECRFELINGLVKVWLRVGEVDFETAPLQKVTVLREITRLARLSLNSRNSVRQNLHFFLRIDTKIVEINGYLDDTHILLRFLNPKAASAEAARLVKDWGDQQKTKSV